MPSNHPPTPPRFTQEWRIGRLTRGQGDSLSMQAGRTSILARGEWMLQGSISLTLSSTYCGCPVRTHSSRASGYATSGDPHPSAQASKRQETLWFSQTRYYTSRQTQPLMILSTVYSTNKLPQPKPEARSRPRTSKLFFRGSGTSLHIKMERSDRIREQFNWFQSTSLCVDQEKDTVENNRPGQRACCVRINSGAGSAH